MPTFYAEDTAASANEVWSRLHSDPLFAVSAFGPRLPAHQCPALFALLVLPESTLASTLRVVMHAESQAAEPLRRALQIKQQEIAARRSIASNPVQMDAIRKQPRRPRRPRSVPRRRLSAPKRLTARLRSMLSLKYRYLAASLGSWWSCVPNEYTSMDPACKSRVLWLMHKHASLRNCSWGLLYGASPAGSRGCRGRGRAQEQEAQVLL